MPGSALQQVISSLSLDLDLTWVGSSSSGGHPKARDLLYYPLASLALGALIVMIAWNRPRKWLEQ
jgi:hypothetical protein